MQTIYFLKGLPASGKSTWAKQFVLDQPANSVKRINKDDLRSMLDAGRYSKGSETFILWLRDFILEQALNEGNHVIIDDTNFEPSHEAHLRKLVKDWATTSTSSRFVVKEFNMPPEECIARNKHRPETDRVPEKVIWDMYHKYVAPKEYADAVPVKQDESLPKAVICDLDGTLALHQGRSPYDCLAASEDALNIPVAKVLWAFEEMEYQLIFFSGRNNGCYEVSRDWLIHQGFQDFILHVRQPNDNRKDAIVKKEMYDEVVKDFFYVESVFDDRNQVVDMWRKELGLTCFQVNYGDF